MRPFSILELEAPLNNGRHYSLASPFQYFCIDFSATLCIAQNFSPSFSEVDIFFHGKSAPKSLLYQQQRSLTLSTLTSFFVHS